MYLILAPTPEVRKWPFYGKALKVLTGEIALSRPVPGTDENAWKDEKVDRFRKDLEWHLAEAKRVVEMLETDLQAINDAFPTKAHEPGKEETVIFNPMEHEG